MQGAQSPLEQPFGIGSWRVDPLRLVVADPSGNEKVLAQRAMSVLLELARAEGAVVRKYDLMKAVWGEAEVGDGALTQAIFELRQALEDDSQHPEYIETIRGVGFRLVPRVCPEVAEPQRVSPRDPSRRWVWGAVVAAVFVGLVTLLASRPDREPPARVSDKSIAVLPFANRSDREEDRYFTDGMHDDLLTYIAAIHGIRTISRTSVMAYRGTSKSAQLIGQELRVSTILEGGVQRSGDQVKVNVQLIDAETDTHLWARSYTRELSAENIFAIQGAIAADVARSLETLLTAEEQRRLQRVPTSNLAALESYFRGSEAVSRGTHVDLWESVTHYEAAIEADSSFAEAHAALANTLLLQIFFSGLPVDGQVERARPHIDRALKLDPELSTAYVAQGHMHVFLREPEAARAAFRRALELNYNSVAALRAYGHFLHSSAGQPGTAVPYFEQALTIAPNSEGIRQQLAEALIAAGDLDRGEAMIREVLEDNPANALALRVLGHALFCYRGQSAEAVQAFRASLAADPNSQSTAAYIALVYENLGDRANTILWLEYAIAIAPASKDVPAYRALVKRASGQTAEAAKMLQELSSESDMYLYLQSDIAWLTHLSGQSEAALDRILARNPRFLGESPAVDRHQLGEAAYAVYFLATQGRQGEADLLAKTALERAGQMPLAVTFGRDLWSAVIHLALGNPDSAIRDLQEFVGAGLVQISLVESPMWQPLRGTPDFETLRAQMSERIAYQRRMLVQMEQSGDLAPIPCKMHDTELCNSMSISSSAAGGGEGV